MRWLERLLLVVGIVALGWYAAVKVAATREQAALSNELEVARAAVSPAPETTDVAPMALVGRLEVPRLNMSAIAREGVDVRTLRSAVGHVPGTALPGAEGNAAFAAHRDTFFGPLKDVRKGDEVLVTTRDGIHRYIVTSTSIVDPSDVSVLRPTGGKTLTLVTCYPFDYIGSAPSRFIVHARGM